MCDMLAQSQRNFWERGKSQDISAAVALEIGSPCSLPLTHTMEAPG